MQLSDPVILESTFRAIRVCWCGCRTAGQEALHWLRLNRPEEEIAEFLAANILIQLRSYPIGLRIDDWLFTEFPELRQAQIHGAHVQLQDNLAALSSPELTMAPKLIVSVNTAMNTAFAAYWAKSLADESLTLPYKAVGALKAGSRLMEIFHYCDTSPIADRTLVDLWAQELGSLDGMRGSYTDWSETTCSAMIFGPFKSTRVRLILRCCRPIPARRIRPVSPGRSHLPGGTPGWICRVVSGDRQGQQDPSRLEILAVNASTN
jgi:hypothetical protein